MVPMSEAGFSGIADITAGAELPALTSFKSKDGGLLKGIWRKFKKIVCRSMENVENGSGRHFCNGRIIRFFERIKVLNFCGEYNTTAI